MKTLISTAVCAAFAAILPIGAPSAQTTTVVFPDGLEAPAEGNTNNNQFPIGGRPPYRQMQIFDPQIIFNNNPIGLGLNIPDGKLIKRFGYRKNGSSDSIPGLWPSPTLVILEIWMADAARASENWSGTFANNFVGGTEMMVFSGTFEVPRLTAPNPIIWFDLQTPFPYNAATGLVVDFRVSLNSNNNQSFTYRTDMKNSWSSPLTSYGIPCQGNAGNNLTFSMSAMRTGSNTSFSVTKGFGNQLVQIGLAISKRATPVVIPAVAGSCELLIDPLAFVGGLLNSSGNFSIGASIPNDLTLFGLEIHGQAFAADPFVAWPLKTISSNGYSRKIGTLPRGIIIGRNGTVQQPLPTSGASGSRNRSTITFFEFMN